MLKHRLLILAGWPVKPRSRSHVYRYKDCTPVGLSKKLPVLKSEKQNNVSLSVPARAGRPPAYLIRHALMHECA